MARIEEILFYYICTEVLVRLRAAMITLSQENDLMYIQLLHGIKGTAEKAIANHKIVRNSRWT